MIEDEVRADEETTGALAAEEATETEGDAVEEIDAEEAADEEAEATVGDEAAEEEAFVEEEAVLEDEDRPEAQSVEEARDPAYKVSEVNPYKPTPADGASE